MVGACLALGHLVTLEHMFAPANCEVVRLIKNFFIRVDRWRSFDEKVSSSDDTAPFRAFLGSASVRSRMKGRVSRTAQSGSCLFGGHLLTQSLLLEKGRIKLVPIHVL